MTVNADKAPAAGSKIIAQVENYPKIPSNFGVKDWKQVARDFDATLFDFNRTGQFMPVIQWDDTGDNGVARTFFMPSYIGSTNQTEPGSQEAITLISLLVGSTLAGINKANQAINENGKITNYNFVKMSQAFYQPSTDFLLDTKSTSDAVGSMWYDIYPGLFFSQLTYLYPKVDKMNEIMKAVCDRWYTAVYKYGPSADKLDFFNSTGFSFFQGRPVYNGSYKEMDSGIGLGMLMYYAYQKFGDKKYLNAAIDCLYGYENSQLNPLYELTGGYAPLLAAKLNAEKGTDFNIEKYIKWNFECDSDDRWGYIGIFNGKLGEYDAQGTYGSYDNGGYNFTMDTFGMAAQLAPVPKYDPRYARSIGRYLLNVINNSKIFYPDAVDASHQSNPWFTGDPKACIPYEGVRAAYKGKSPYLMGDPTEAGWGETDLGVYSGSMVGYIAALANKTNDSKIYQFDLNKLDFFGKNSYPVYMYYNPYDSAKSVSLNVGTTRRDIYDSVTNTYIAKNVSGVINVPISADNSVVVNILPAGGKFTSLSNGRLFMNGQFIGQKKPAVNITNLYHKQKVTDSFTLESNISLPEGDTLQSVTIKMGGRTIFSGSSLASSIQISTSEMSNGMNTLGIYVQTASGYQDYTELQLLVANSKTSYVVNFTSDDILNMDKINASVAEKDTMAEIYSSSQSGGVMSREFTIDLDRNPILYLDAPYIEYGINVRMVYSDNSNIYGDILILGGNSRNQYVSNICNDLVRHSPTRIATGKHKVKLQINTNGFNGSRSVIKNMFVMYPNIISLSLKPPAHGINSLRLSQNITSTPAATSDDSITSESNATESTQDSSVNGASSQAVSDSNASSSKTDSKTVSQTKSDPEPANNSALVIALLLVGGVIILGGTGAFWVYKKRKKAGSIDNKTK